MFVNNEQWKNQLPPSYLRFDGYVGSTTAGIDYFNYVLQRMRGATSYLEIGTFDGIILAMLAKALPSVKFSAIDPFLNVGGGHFDYFEDNCRQYNNIHLYNEKSEVVLPQLIERGDRFDIIFVDGDHTYEAVSMELREGWKLLNGGGSILVHDYSIPGVNKACNEFAQGNGLKLNNMGFVLEIGRK
jgi:predicted O-methyltransferase YrrM